MDVPGVNEELDDEPKSEHTGVTWIRKAKRWQCQVYNPLTKKDDQEG